LRDCTYLRVREQEISQSSIDWMHWMEVLVRGLQTSDRWILDC
jgi:hypothetical protein